MTAVLAPTRSPHDCHFRVEVKTISRSAGRSAVFASAYRSGERLHDGRQGLTADYTRKQGIVGTMILAPDGAPSWVYDRSTLWTKAELSEKHPRATTARELVVSIPREIDPADHAEWVRSMCAVYTEAQAVCDIALHSPSAADGQPNYHAHIMLTERALAPDGQGFERTKNAALLGMFQSGGRMGGSPGDAIKRERERWSQGINDYMRAHGLTARADHRSRQDRGAADLETEPRYGEMAASRYRRTKKQPSRNQQIVGAMRHRRRMEQVATAVGVAMEHAVQQSSKVPYRQSKQDIKQSLLRERIPDLDVSKLGKDDIYRVDVSSQSKTVVQMRDDSIVEMRGGRLYVYGTQGGTAETLAAAIAEAQGWEQDVITRLPPSVRMRAPEGKYRRRAKSEEEIERLVAYWQQAGYVDVSTCKQGVWVTLGASRLLDSGDRVTLHGPINDSAITAMISKAKAEWSGKCEISGSDDFKARIYLEACRQGVEIVGGYDPPPHVLAQAEAERKQRDKEAAAVATVTDRAAEAREVLRFVRGEISAPAISPEMGAYLETLMDKKGQFDSRGGRALANMGTAQLIPLLADMESKGAKLLEEQAATEAAQAPKPKQRRKDDEPDADTPDAPAPGRKR